MASIPWSGAPLIPGRASRAVDSVANVDLRQPRLDTRPAVYCWDDDVYPQRNPVTKAQNDKTANFTAACSLISMIANRLGAKIPRPSGITADNVSKYEAPIAKAIEDLRDAEGLPGTDITAAPIHTFDDLVDQEIARMGDDAKPRPGNLAASIALAKPIDRTVAEAALFGIELLVDIGRELGIDVIGQTPGDAARAIHAALLKLKNPGDVGGDDGTPSSKGDSLAEAMSFGRKAEANLLEEVTRLRLIVQRVASAMQVPSWDKDGTELIERAQRWDQARYMVKRRIVELESSNGSREGGVPCVETAARDHAAATELRFMLGLLASPKDIAKWLANKPKAVVTSQVLDVLEKPTGIEPFGELTPSDTVMLSESLTEGATLYLQDSVAARQRNLCKVFTALARSVTASTEFCDLVNLIILPILARQNQPTPAR